MKKGVKSELLWLIIVLVIIMLTLTLIGVYSSEIFLGNDSFLQNLVEFITNLF